MLTNCGRKERNTNRKWVFHQTVMPRSRMHCLSSSNKSTRTSIALHEGSACAGCLSAQPLNFTSNSPLISNCYQMWQTGLFSALVDVIACFKTEQTTKRLALRTIREMKMLSNLPIAKLELCLVVRLNLQGQKSWGKAMLQPSWMPATESVTASTQGSDLLTNTSGWSTHNFDLEDLKRLTSHIPFYKYPYAFLWIPCFNILFNW